MTSSHTGHSERSGSLLQLAADTPGECPEASSEFYDTIDTLIVGLSAEGRIRMINRVCRDVTGYSCEEAEGQFFWDFFFKSQRHELIWNLLEEASRPPYRTTYEDPWRTREGEERLISFTIASLRDEQGVVSNYTVTGLDITKLRRMEEELWHYRTGLEEQIRQRNAELVISQSRLSGILETAEDAIISIDAKQQILMFNQGAEKIFGYRADEVLGKSLGMLMPERFRSPHFQLVLKFGKSEQTSRRMNERAEIRGLRKDGAEFSSEANISQLDLQGERIYTAILRDISERKQIEDDLRKSLDEKDVLLREIHHRVKNNLQVISSLFTLQTAGTDDPERLTLLRESQHRIQSMALIHEKIYQSESLAQIHFEQYVKDLVTEIFQSYQIASTNVRLSFDLHPVSLDINKAIPCALILNELTSNALKYAFSKPEHRSGRSDRVFSVSVKLDNEPGKEQELLLTVQDNGRGLPKDFNFNSAKTLGLRLVRVLTRQLKGEIELRQNKDSGKCRGTMFVFRIPLKAVDN